MRSLALLIVFLPILVYSRVTFDYSQVLQASDLDFQNKTKFSLRYTSKVYVDRKYDKLVITQGEDVIVNFNTIVGDAPYVPAGVQLLPGDYKIENRGQADPAYVVYIVASGAPNDGAPVYVPSSTVGIAVKDHARYVTVLSSFDAIGFMAFEGAFPDGYPRIYSAGFDAANDQSCRAVFKRGDICMHISHTFATTQLSATKSLPLIASAVVTVDFGFVGAHNVSIYKADFSDPPKAEGASTAYMSPGYVGCYYDPEGNYYSRIDEVHDGKDGFMSGFVGTGKYEKQFGYEHVTYNFNISWTRTTPTSSFALQLDWDVYGENVPTTTTPKPFTMGKTTPRLPTTAGWYTTTTTFLTTTKPTPAISDSYCSCAVDKFGMPDGWQSTEIWLDIVIVLDTSEAMGESSLEDAATLIESLIGDVDYDVLITDPRSSFFTRIGVIAMSDTAEVLYNLNMTKADTVTDKVKVSTGVKKIDVMHAFESAVDMFAQGLRTNPDRASTRNVIYYLTDSDAVINATALDEFKQHGTIIAEQFAKKGENEKSLTQLASNGYYFKTNDRSPIQIFCTANCFCAPDRVPYAGNSTDVAVIAAGGCFHAPSTGLQFGKAVKECANNRGNGELVSVHDSEKADFINDLVTSATNKPYYFWIGYSKGDDGQWRWEDQSTDPYTNWDVDEPSSASVSKCAYVDQTQANLPWGAGNCQIVFPYVCEYAPCAVGNKNC